MTDTTTTEVTAYAVLPDSLWQPVWDMYLAAFIPTRADAAQRHVMYWEEYTDLMSDPRVTKFVAATGDRVDGVAVITNDLKAVPLIEPEFFATRHPDLYARGYVWYMVFVCTRPKAPRGTFKALISLAAEPVRRVRGVCWMDYSQTRVDRGLPRLANAILLGDDDRAVHERGDAQTYWAYHPSGEAS